MRVVIGCEESGVVRDAFLAAGHDAISVDLIASGSEGPHYCGDILEFLEGKRFDLGIFHPPCDRIANSGVHWLARRNLWEDMRKASVFFKALLEARSCDRVAVENPIPHKYALEIIGRK